MATTTSILVQHPTSSMMDSTVHKNVIHHHDHLTSHSQQSTDVINVFLKMWDGKTLCCVLEPYQQASLSTAVACLQQKILDSYPGYDRRNFFLELHGKALKTTTSFDLDTMQQQQHDYCRNKKSSNHKKPLVKNNTNLRNNVCVFVHYRNRGGCFMISFSILMTILGLIVASTCTCGSSLLLIPLLLPFLFILPLFCL